MHILFGLIGLLVAVPLIMFLVGLLISAPRYRGPVSDHFDGARFTNPGGARAKGGLAVLRWILNRKRGPWNADLSENFGKRPLGHYKEGIRVTFVNHSTFLIQADGVNILTDPVWSHRVSPFPWLGPKRMKMPGIKFGDLPRIHVVLLTHNHYDHLDLPTLQMIFGAHHPKIITPLGLKSFLDRNYVSGAAEVDWWQETVVGDELTIQAVPAQHFSGRGILDRDATLWCGYMIKTSSGNIYFAGDTGYNQAMFKETASRCGPVRVALLPIGAYKPAWFMSAIHVSPEEAISIHNDVGAQTSIGMHFGTFPLADDGCDEPASDLQIAIQKAQLASQEFLLLREGEATVFER